MDEFILRATTPVNTHIVIQFDGRVVEVFGPWDPIRGHVARMGWTPTIDKPDKRGRCLVRLWGASFGIDADEATRLRPLLDKITAAIRAAQAELAD
jgi:hypothetical protein